MFSVRLKTCLDVALCKSPNLASWVQLGFRSTAGFPIWLLEQMILFVRNEFLILYESICHGQSQEKQFKRAHLPFLTPHHCSPKQHVGRGRSLHPCQTLRAALKEERPAVPCLLGAAQENRRCCSHSSSLGCEEPSTYGASGEQGEAQGNPALIDKPVTS